jgi:hypothetical protein
MLYVVADPKDPFGEAWVLIEASDEKNARELATTFTSSLATEDGIDYTEEDQANATERWLVYEADDETIEANGLPVITAENATTLRREDLVLS